MNNLNHAANAVIGVCIAIYAVSETCKYVKRQGWFQRKG